MRDKAIVIHGFSPNPKNTPNGRDPEFVIDDRLDAAYEEMQNLKSDGYSPDIIFTGGGNYGGFTEAELVELQVEESHPELAEAASELEAESRNTVENVERTLEMSQDRYDDIHVITSRDHAPRVLRDWTERAEGVNVYAVPSEETYTDRDNQAFILEDGPLREIYDSLTGVWGILDSDLSEISKDIEDVWEKYRE